MWPENPDDWENGEVRFSEAVDLLLEWGYLHLLIQGTPQGLQRLEREFEEVLARENFVEDLRSGFERLSARVDSALRLLHGSATLETGSSEDEGVVGAIRTLDQVVFLIDGVENMPKAGVLPDWFMQEAEGLLCRVTVKELPPALRLVPLNDWRKDVSERIPDEQRYLFPWYQLWNDLPPDTLERIIQSWDQVVRGEWAGLGIDEGDLRAILADLNADPELLKFIRREARLHKAITQVAGEDRVLALLAIGDDAAQKHAAPSGMTMAGLVSAARKVMRREVRCEEDRLERLFLGAFCGPELEDDQRLEIFSYLEDALAHRAVPADYPVLLSLQEWFQGRLTDKELARKAFDLWMGRFKEAAKGVAALEPGETFWQALTELRASKAWIAAPQIARVLEVVHGRLRRLGSVASDVLETVKDFVERLSPWISPQPFELRPVSVPILAGPGEAVPHEQPIMTVSGPWHLKLKWEEETRTYPLLIPDETAGEGFRELLNFLDRVDFYWAAWVIRDKGQVEVIDTRRGRLPCHRLPEGKYCLVVLALATDRQLLERASKGIASGETPETGAVVWIFYTPEP